MRVLSLIHGVALLALPLVGVGCIEACELPEGVDPGCTGCHGTADLLAPPPSTWLSGSKIETTDRQVGAHVAHLRASTFTGPIPCESCHLVPEKIADEGHMDTALPAEVTFGEAARGDLRDPPLGLEPVWDGASLTCQSTYCHSLDGGTTTSPSWTEALPMVCGSCHGIPPAKTLTGADHVASTVDKCAACHGAVVNKGGKITDPGKHVNGVVDFN